MMLQHGGPTLTIFAPWALLVWSLGALETPTNPGGGWKRNGWSPKLTSTSAFFSDMAGYITCRFRNSKQV